MHSCMGINELKLLHELAKCLLLLWRACVLGRFPVLGHATNIADANAVGIMPQTMGASYVLEAADKIAVYRVKVFLFELF